MNATVQKQAFQVVVTLPLRTRSESNARGHWAPKARRAKGQRGPTCLAVAASTRDVVLPAIVTLTRIAPRRLDDDNLRGALKAVRDGVADAFGLTDADPKLEWRYDQRRGQKNEYAVEIRVVTAG